MNPLPGSGKFSSQYYTYLLIITLCFGRYVSTYLNDTYDTKYMYITDRYLIGR